MRISLVLLFVLISCSGLMAQDSTIVTVKAGNSVRDVLTSKDIYFRPDFVTGKVFFRNGIIAAAKMNYNSLTDQVLFIDPQGDTLALTDELTILFIAMDKDTFYFNDGYLRLVASYGDVKLAERRFWQLMEVRRIGSHNRPSSTYSVTSFRSVTDQFGRTFDLSLDEDRVIRKKPQYYFGDMHGSFVPAMKKNLLSFFAKQETELSAYFKRNKVNFNDRHDLEKVAQFLEQTPY